MKCACVSSASCCCGCTVTSSCPLALYQAALRLRVPLQNTTECMSNPVCYTPALSKHLILLRDENELFEYLTNHPHELDAAIVFPHAQAAAAACRPGVTNSACGDTASLLLPPGIAGDGSSGVLTYALRFNSSDVPPTALTRDIFDVSPGAMPLPGNLLWTWRRYWFFVNLQLALDRALLGGHIGHGTAPAPLRVRVKPFPWCAAAAGSDKRHKEAQTGTIHQPHPAPLCALRAGGKIQFFEIQFSLVTPLPPSNLVLDTADIPHPPAPDILLAACCGLCIAETHPAPLHCSPTPCLYWRAAAGRRVKRTWVQRQQALCSRCCWCLHSCLRRVQ